MLDTRWIAYGRSSFFLLFSSLCSLCLCGASLNANPPVASYLFPAGGQRGKLVNVRVGGLFLYQSCSFEMLGPGVEASRTLQRTRTVWFEGPLLPLPESQQAEDYPKDLAGQVRIAADAPLGARIGRIRTAEGAASGLKFIVGDLPEIVEEEIDGDPVPVKVQLPVTINGRIFPRGDVDVWSFTARRGETISAEVCASRLGSPLDSYLEILDPHGRVLAENDDAHGSDSFVRFTAPADGIYSARIRDVNGKGGQAFVYRLTLTAGPYVDRVYPLGGRRGSKTRFTLYGQGVPSEAVTISLPEDAQPDFIYRHPSGGQLSNPVLIDVDELPEYEEHEPNDEPGQAPVVALPAIVNGRIGKPGDVDCWAFRARKGEVCTFELRAAKLGSPLQGVLTVLDEKGKEMGRAEAAAGQADPIMRFTAPADAVYCVRVADRFHGRGGPSFSYRLRMTGTQTPGFRLRLAADVVTLPRKGQAKLKVTAERSGGFKELITLVVDGLPAGVKTTNAVLAANQNATDVTFTAEPTAAIVGARLTIRGTAQVGGKAVSQTATMAAPRGMPAADSVLLAVALPVPFKIVGDYDMRWAARGTVHRRKYRIERNGFDGPLEINLADRQARHLQGVSGPTVVVPAGATEFEYAVQLPPWMEIGRTSRSCVMAVGIVKEGGHEYTVGYSSVNPNEQMVTVVETGRLGIEADKASIAAVPDGSVSVAVKVVRGKPLIGAVKLEMVVAEHVRGVRADPVTIPADRDQGTITIHFTKNVAGPFNVPLILRATLDSEGGPVIAETKLECVPGE